MSRYLMLVLSISLSISMVVACTSKTGNSNGPAPKESSTVKPQAPPTSTGGNLPANPSPPSAVAPFDLGAVGHFRADGMGPIFSVTYFADQSWTLSFQFGSARTDNLQKFDPPDVVGTSEFYKLEVALFDGTSGRVVSDWKTVRDSDPEKSLWVEHEHMITIGLGDPSEAKLAIASMANLKLSIRYTQRDMYHANSPIETESRWIDLGKLCHTNPQNFHDLAGHKSGCPAGPNTPENLTADEVWLTDFLRTRDAVPLALTREDGKVACEKLGLRLPLQRELVRYDAVSAGVDPKEQMSDVPVQKHQGNTDWLFFPLTNPGNTLDAFYAFSFTGNVCQGHMGHDEGVWSSSNMRSIPDRNIYWAPDSHSVAMCEFS